jgi:hypothetical protein
MEKLAVYNSMSFNKKRIPELSELKRKHAELGDAYLEQFLSGDAIIGPIDSGKYLDDYIKSKDPNKLEPIPQVLSLLIEAKELLLNRGSSKYIDDFNDLQKIINSITNKQ